MKSSKKTQKSQTQTQKRNQKKKNKPEPDSETMTLDARNTSTNRHWNCDSHNDSGRAGGGKRREDDIGYF